MARVMKRVFGAAANNSFATPITAPGGKKIEVISSRIGLAGAGGAIVAHIAVVSGTNYLVGGSVNTPAGPADHSIESNGILLEPGDSWMLGVFTNGAAWPYFVTYVEVDV